MRGSDSRSQTENCLYLVPQLMLLYDNNMIMFRKYSDTNLTPERKGEAEQSRSQFNVTFFVNIFLPQTNSRF